MTVAPLHASYPVAVVGTTVATIHPQFLRWLQDLTGETNDVIVTASEPVQFAMYPMRAELPISAASYTDTAGLTAFADYPAADQLPIPEANYV